MQAHQSKPKNNTHFENNIRKKITQLLKEFDCMKMDP